MTVGDYNNDGFEDLFITYWGQNVLYRNNGDGTFTDVTKAAGLLSGAQEWASGCTWIDYDRDGHSIYSSRTTRGSIRERSRSRARRELQLEGVPVNCGPRGFHPRGTSYTATTETEPSPTSARNPAYPKHQAATA